MIANFRMLSISTVSTFSINGQAIGTQQTITLNGQQQTIVGFAPGAAISTIVNQINSQLRGAVQASVDGNGVLILQSLNGQPVVVASVDQVTHDATGNDLTNGTNVPLSTGGSTSKDLGLSNNVDNAIGSVDVVAMDQVMASVDSVRADVGAKLNRVQENTTRLSSLGVTLAKLDSNIEDVDMAKALSDLATSQTTFQAALGAAAKVLPPTLLDFLR